MINMFGAIFLMSPNQARGNGYEIPMPVVCLYLNWKHFSGFSNVLSSSSAKSFKGNDDQTHMLRQSLDGLINVFVLFLSLSALYSGQTS